MKIVATLACRANSSRLYGKPLQYLEKVTVLEYMVNRIAARPEIAAVVLAISEARGNEAFIELAEQKGWQYILGDDRDVLQRLIRACQHAGGDTIFRVTTESPFPYFEGLPEAVKSHTDKNADYTAHKDLPDGVFFELISLKALETSWNEGDRRHRSELCSLFIRENRDRFVMNELDVPPHHRRPDYRLTIDYPEDLMQCRQIVYHFGGDDVLLKYEDIIHLLDNRPDLTELVNNLAEKNKIHHIAG